MISNYCPHCGRHLSKVKFHCLECRWIRCVCGAMINRDNTNHTHADHVNGQVKINFGEVCKESAA